MAEELAKELQNFRLSEEEEAVIGLNQQSSNTNGLKNKISLMMVGKLLTGKPFNFEAMKRTLRTVWRLKHDVAIRMVENNLFIFQFSSTNDKAKVIQGAPWFFDNQLLLIKDINGDDQLSDIEFKSTPCWVRIYDMPFALRNDATAKEVGECMGAKPLRRGFKIAVRTNTTKWVDVKYERLGDFCYFCGRLGHTDKDCPNIAEEDESPKSTREDSEKEKALLSKIQDNNGEKSARSGAVEIIKLGPPSSAKKALFQDTRSSEDGVEVISDNLHLSNQVYAGVERGIDHNASSSYMETRNEEASSHNHVSPSSTMVKVMSSNGVKAGGVKWKRLARPTDKQAALNSSQQGVIDGVTDSKKRGIRWWDS
ncbi:DNA topoisomerase 1 [Bienertia sinuspersici]